MPPPVAAAATSFTLVWAIELALARVTGQPQTWADTLASGALLILVPSALLALGLGRQAPRALCAALATLPLVFVAGGIVVPVAHHYSGVLAAALLVVALAVLLLQQVRRDADEPLAPSAGLVLVVLVAATATAWVLLPSGFPPFQVHLPFLLAAMLLARLTAREFALPLIALAGVALAFWPPVLPPFPWTAAAGAGERPDIFVVSIDATADEVTVMPAFERLKATGERYTVAVPRDGDGVTLMRSLFRGERDRAVQPLAMSLSTAGYDTAAVIGAAPAFDVDSGMHKGFAVFHHFIDRNRFALPRARANFSTSATALSDFAARPLAADALIALGLRAAPQFAAADELFAVAAKVMSERRENPVFLWIHFRDRMVRVNEQMRRLLDTLAGAAEKPHAVVLLSAGRTAGEPAALVIGGSDDVAIRPSELPQLEPTSLAAFLRGLGGSD